MNGLKLAALYSYPPAKLGFCGKVKNSPQILAGFLINKNTSLKLVKKVLKGFQASFPYYQLIAKSNRIKNPFNIKVVEAYWLGNRLLNKVKFSSLKKTIKNSFTKPGLLTVNEAEKRIASLPKNAKPHHSFHVFLLGPIAGKINFYGPLYDLCRISWGEIVKIKNQKSKIKNYQYRVVVRYKPLIIKNKKFLLGSEIKKEISWNKEFLPNLKIGNLVSFHWNNICQKINKNQQKNLLKYTFTNLGS